MSVAPTHRFTATFVDRALEAQFARESFALTTRPITRFTISLSAAVFLLYGVHDYFVLPAGRVHEAWAIRYGGRRRDRQEEVHLRRVGRHGERREPHGVDRGSLIA